MGREVHFAEKEFVLKLKGVLSIFALKWELKIPYIEIKSIYIDEFDPPMWMLRMPGTAIAPLNIFEGSFKFADEWYFLSYEHKVPLINIELDGSRKYKYVIFEVQNPREVLIELRKRIRDIDVNNK